MARRKSSSAVVSITSDGEPKRSPATPMPPGSRADYVHMVLRQEILDGALPPGTPILQDEIARRLGVSITPVREALRRLESVGLVSYRAHFGATVTELSEEAAVELYMLRGAVEGLTARLAANRINRDQLAELYAIHASMETARRSHDVVMLAEGSRQFHTTVAAVGGPAFLAGHVKWIQVNYPVPLSDSLWQFDDVAERAIAAHRALLDALERRDAVEAQHVMAEHVEHVADYRQKHRGEALPAGSARDRRDERDAQQ